MVPCSRSRTTAAPARMIASMVTLLMMPMTLVNQAVVTLGLKAMRTTRLTGGDGRRLRVRERKSAISVVDDLLGVAGAEAGLHHGRGVDVDLQRRAAAGQHVALEVGRDVDDEGVTCPCSSADRCRARRSTAAA